MRTAVDFYKSVLSLKSTLETDRMTVFPLGSTTLMLFQLGATESDSHPKGHPELTVPGHGPSKAIVDAIVQNASSPTEGIGKEGAMLLKQHYCLAVESRKDVEDWERHFKDNGVEITGIMNWPKGGRSVYFADPDGNVGEIASKGIWPHY